MKHETRLHFINSYCVSYLDEIFVNFQLVRRSPCKIGEVLVRKLRESWESLQEQFRTLRSRYNVTRSPCKITGSPSKLGRLLYSCYKRMPTVAPRD